jgi:hypothetical protein
MNAYLTDCRVCRRATSRAYAYKNAGRCKACVMGKETEPRPLRPRPSDRYADRAEQAARYLDAGPQAWDDRDES